MKLDSIDRSSLRLTQPARRLATQFSAAVATALALYLPATPVWADPNDYVNTPIVEEGEKEVDLKWGVARARDGSSANATSLGLGWGVNAWWSTELYAKFQHPSDNAQNFDAWEWENKFQLTETGRYPVDVAWLLEIERPKDRSEGYELTHGLLLQAEWSRLQANLNLLWQKHVRNTTPLATELHYQAQIKYRGSQALEWGLQALGTARTWGNGQDPAPATHNLGPALFGKLKGPGLGAIKYNAALLLGSTQASPRATLRVQTEYEF